MQGSGVLYTHFPCTLLGLIDREDRGPMPLRNVGNCLPLDTAQHLRRLESSFSTSFFVILRSVFVSFVSARCTAVFTDRNLFMVPLTKCFKR
jgi:hypothetical protein